MKSRGGIRGFTLVEIMIVVVIIGLLAALAIPAFNRARERSQATALANNFRTYAAAFEVYCMENGYWPADVNRGTIPAGMEGQLPRFTETTIAGGNWDWDPGILGYAAAVTLVGATAGNGLLLRVDEILDDGDPTTGKVRFNGTHLSYVLEF